MKKQKSRLISVLLLIPILLLAACGKEHAPSSSDAMAGSYRLVDAAGEGSYDLLEIKDGVNMEVHSDTSATLSLMTDRHEIVFDPAAGTCTSDSGAPVPYTFDGKQLVLDSEDFRMVFEKQ